MHSFDKKHDKSIKALAMGYKPGKLHYTGEISLLLTLAIVLGLVFPAILFFQQFCSKLGCKMNVLIVLLEYIDLRYHVLIVLLECIIQHLGGATSYLELLYFSFSIVMLKCILLNKVAPISYA